MSSSPFIVQLPKPTTTIIKRPSNSVENYFENMYNAFDYARKNKLKTSEFVCAIYTDSYISPKIYEYDLPIRFSNRSLFHHIEMQRIMHLINYAYEKFPLFETDIDLAIDFSDSRQFILVTHGLHDECVDGFRSTHFTIKLCGDPKQVRQFHIYPNNKPNISDGKDPFIFNITRILQYCV